MHANIYGNGKWHQPLRSLKFCLWDCRLWYIVSFQLLVYVLCFACGMLNWITFGQRIIHSVNCLQAIAFGRIDCILVLVVLTWTSSAPKRAAGSYSLSCTLHTLHPHAGLSSLTLCWTKLTNQIQRRLKVSSTQLLYQSSPYQSAVLLVTGPFVDKLLTKRDVFAFSYTTQVVVSTLAQ